MYKPNLYGTPNLSKWGWGLVNKSKTEIVLVSFIDYIIDMFKWLKNKVQEKSDKEYKNGIKRIYNFLKFAKGSKDNHDQLKQDLLSIDTTINILEMSANEPKNMDKLLNVDMICRKIYEVEYGGKASEFNKKFDPKK